MVAAANAMLPTTAKMDNSRNNLDRRWSAVSAFILRLRAWRPRLIDSSLSRLFASAATDFEDFVKGIARRAADFYSRRRLRPANPVLLIQAVIDVRDGLSDNYRWMGAQPPKNGPASFIADSGERMHNRAECVEVRLPRR